MKVKMKYLLMIIAMSFAVPSFAYFKGKDKDGGKSNQNGFDGKANCAPATAVLIMEFNNVRAVLNTNGVLFRDYHNGGKAGYEVPKVDVGIKRTAIYAASLWMGGTDVNNQLRLAATTFGEGNDFWTGPLTVNLGTGTYDPKYPVGDNATRDYGEASILPQQCAKYDKFFSISKAEVIQFITWWEINNGITQPGPDAIAEPSAESMDRILNWPAHGDPTLGQDHYLAPFYDRAEQGSSTGNGVYNPMEDGDYPWYDDIIGRDDVECGVDRRITLFGDQTNWWIFNDKGNIHTSSNSQDPIGMEIRAQAFAFTTADEINNMTFYNYEMINRGTQTLYNTFFSQYVDPDLGGGFDDYIGCDVSRGLGYCYNGDNYDDDYQGNPGYGSNPPAIGVDFFEGPYQNADGRDNYGPYKLPDGTDAPMSVAAALADTGIVYKGLGIGYHDGKIDNERFGMKRFSYYSNAPVPAPQADPSTAPQFYNYMKGRWRYGDDMTFGGDGIGGTIHADYMFPGDSDPLNWSTAGVAAPFQGWAENNTDGSGGSRQPGDRRFVQSAGPFTLKPGAINNITVGFVYARSTEGDLLASVRALKIADTKAQALFDNCFELLDPPNAPTLTIQELDKELVLMLSNPVNSNNYREKYKQEDKVGIPDPIGGGTYDKFYRFEGYQIFQLKDASVSVSDIFDTDKARLVAQCDLNNQYKDLINYELNEELGITIGSKKVKAANSGIQHSFKITEDQFAQGVRTIVNHKKYYYVAVAYAVNMYKQYIQNDPTALDGQKIPYISSRINPDGTAIRTIEAIPHNPAPEANGSSISSSYGDMPEITVIDGYGNGNMALQYSSESLNSILANGFVTEPTYKKGAGPVNVKVVDPLNVAGGYYEIKFNKYGLNSSYPIYVNNQFGTDTASWTLYRYESKGGALVDSVNSEKTIAVGNEQIIPEWGISVDLKQTLYYYDDGTLPSMSTEAQRTTDVVGSSIKFADSTKQWLTGIFDTEDYFPTNWILSGTKTLTQAEKDVVGVPEYTSAKYYEDLKGDKDQRFEKILGGIVAPQCFVNDATSFSPIAHPSYLGGGIPTTPASTYLKIRPSRLPSFRLVITSDKSKWTRAAVIELNRYTGLSVGGAKQGSLRAQKGVDKNGNPIDGFDGLGWFPGYAIDLETGMRLQIAFGENSYLSADGGSDMIWNPSSNVTDNNGNPVLGGMQPVYVFGYNMGGLGCPYYTDGNDWVYNQMKTNTGSEIKKVYESLAWVFFPRRVKGHEMLESDFTMDVNINKEYSEFQRTGRNNARPMFGFSLDNYAPIIGSNEVMAEALKIINVVPNPYYAYSSYELSRLDTRVKIINLPDKCEVKIYNVSGKLIKTYKKDSPITSIEWDLKNSKGIPVASGVYLIHVDVPGVGERILKFFGGMRQPDMENI
jgi:hypothetical protein